MNVSSVQKKEDKNKIHFICFNHPKNKTISSSKTSRQILFLFRLLLIQIRIGTSSLLLICVHLAIFAYRFLFNIQVFCSYPTCNTFQSYNLIPAFLVYKYSYRISLFQLNQYSSFCVGLCSDIQNSCFNCT